MRLPVRLSLTLPLSVTVGFAAVVVAVVVVAAIGAGAALFRWRRCVGGGATVFAAIAAAIAVIFSRAIGADAACDIFFLGGLDVGAALLAVVVGVAIALVSALTCAVALKLRRDRECDAAEICGARMASHCVQLVQNVKQVFCITSAYRFRERLYVTDSTYCAELVVRARLYWFRCFFGTEIGFKSVFIFCTLSEVTNLPHIV